MASKINYKKGIWRDGQKCVAYSDADLNKLEAGVKAACDAADNATGQPYIEEWKKSEADRSSNLCDNATFLDGVTFFTNCSANYSNGQLNIVSTGEDSYIGDWGLSPYNPEYGKRINVKPDTTYTLSTGSSDITTNFITLYDSNGTMVSSIAENQTNITTFTTPSTCAFITIRVGYESSVAGTTYPFNIMLSEGSAPLPYQPYEGPVVHEGKFTLLEGTVAEVKAKLVTYASTYGYAYIPTMVISVSYLFLSENDTEWIGGFIHACNNLDIRVCSDLDGKDVSNTASCKALIYLR